MAAGLPAKTNWATNDVFTSAGVDDLAGTVNLLGLSTVTATAAGTTVLTVASHRKQTFTGTTTQTVTLPVVSTLSLGDTFEIDNSSTGIVTVQSSGANSVVVMATMTRAVFVCVLITGTTAASWTVAAAASGAGPIQTIIASGTPATISFPSIAATYRNLRIVYSGQASAGSYATLLLRFNADTAANYDSQRLYGNTTSAGVTESFGLTSAIIGIIGQTHGGSGQIVIPNYKDTTFNKFVTAHFYAKSGTASGNMWSGVYGAAWRSSVAITQIDLTMDSAASFVNGSTFTLYGEM